MVRCCLQYRLVWSHVIHRIVLLFLLYRVCVVRQTNKNCNLPSPTNTRTKDEGNVVGIAAEAFNIPRYANYNYVGYIMGKLILPPSGIKDAESVGPCSQTFTVCARGRRKPSRWPLPIEMDPREGSKIFRHNDYCWDLAICFVYRLEIRTAWKIIPKQNRAL
jgi:hypothetical protein